MGNLKPKPRRGVLMCAWAGSGEDTASIIEGTPKKTSSNPILEAGHFKSRQHLCGGGDALHFKIEYTVGCWQPKGLGCQSMEPQAQTVAPLKF